MFAEPMELALADFGLTAPVGVPANTPGAVQVVALCRHKVDGLVAYAGQTYWLARERAEAGAAREYVHIMGSGTFDWWKAPGRVLSPFEGDGESVFARTPSAGALKILQGCGYDPGAAAYRTHSAINSSTKHASAFVRFDDKNPHTSLRQLDGLRDAALVRDALMTADVLHCHMNTMLLANTNPPTLWREGQSVVRHYHGSRPDGRTTLEHELDAKIRDRLDGGVLVRLGARLTLCNEPDASDLQWLPIPMPVARYQALREKMFESSPVFTVAHSPTKRQYKGTDKFMAAIEAVKQKGLKVSAILIEGRSHSEALAMKACCDAVFDSLWLGLQGSGLEGGAMGIPCIAGDMDVAALYKAHVGYVPYTFAGDQQGIANAIERLATDNLFYVAEASRLQKYVSEYHDYSQVAKRYERILAEAMGRADIITTAPTPTRKRGKVAA